MVDLLLFGPNNSVWIPKIDFVCTIVHHTVMKFAMNKDWLTLSPTFARIDGFMFYFVMADLTEPPHAHIGEGKTPLSSDGKIWLDTLTIATGGRLSAH
jgi:hypothetical protein